MQTLTGFRDAVRFLRQELSSDLGLQAIDILMEVKMAHPEPILHRELSTRVGVSAATISRNVRVLGITYAKDEAGKTVEYGFKLITSGPDKFVSKQFAVEMTTKGLNFMKRLERKLKLERG